MVETTNQKFSHHDNAKMRPHHQLNGPFQLCRKILLVRCLGEDFIIFPTATVTWMQQMSCDVAGFSGFLNKCLTRDVPNKGSVAWEL